MVGKINNQTKIHLKLPKQQQIEKSLWSSFIDKCDKEIEQNKGDVQVIYRELNQFNTPSKKKKHIMGKLRNKIRNIDYLRVTSIIKEFELEDNIDKLVAYCSNHGIFMKKLHQVQDNIHKHIVEICDNQMAAERLEKLQKEHQQMNQNKNQHQNQQQSQLNQNNNQIGSQHLQIP